jgi:hypothetical protein
MTIYWEPDYPDNPTSFYIWHVRESDGSVAGPITTDSGNMDDEYGGTCPDVVRERITEWLESTLSLSDPRWRQLLYDMLELDYERGRPNFA